MYAETALLDAAFAFAHRAAPVEAWLQLSEWWPFRVYRTAAGVLTGCVARSAKVRGFPMLSLPVSSSTRVYSPWLPPVIDEPTGGAVRRAWPAPPLAPIEMPELLRQRLLDGLLAACKRELQRRRSLPPGAMPNLRPLDEYTSIGPAALSLADARRRATTWLLWLLKAEAEQALRVLLAPSSETAATRWRAALTRQAGLASHLAQIALLYQALEERLGRTAALAALDAALEG